MEILSTVKPDIPKIPSEGDQVCKQVRIQTLLVYIEGYILQCR